MLMNGTLKIKKSLISSKLVTRSIKLELENFKCVGQAP